MIQQEEDEKNEESCEFPYGGDLDEHSIKKSEKEIKNISPKPSNGT
jgi:hypothetical protein